MGIGLRKRISRKKLTSGNENSHKNIKLRKKIESAKNIMDNGGDNYEYGTNIFVSFGLGNFYWF